jgi:transposase
LERKIKSHHSFKPERRFAMSLKARPIPDIPQDTARIARAAFQKGNTWMSLRDELGSIYRDEDFASLFSTRGQPAQAPWQLALVTIMQFAEGLSDTQAASCVCARIDWKYALSLELTDPGFDSSVLCEFRARLISGQAEKHMLEAILELCRERKWIKERGKQRSDSTHVLAAIHVLNRLESVGTTLRHALNTLAVAAPEWLRAQAEPEWIERYGARIDEYRLPKGKAERIALGEIIGADGHKLLEAIYADDAPEWLSKLPAVETLRRVWVQQYYLTKSGSRWRTTEEHGLAPGGVAIHSPHDPDARYSDKRSTTWVGYKAHLTETCDEDNPRLITDVKTTEASVPDHEVVEDIHRELSAKELLPAVHLLDAGYINANLIVRSKQQYGVELCGPSRPDTGWQAQAGKGFAASDFSYDWEKRQATCPSGKQSSSWQEATDRYGKAQVKIKFSVLDCRQCSHHSDCTKIERRILTVYRKEEFLALQQAREREKTKEYAKLYAKRAGVEGCLSQAVRGSDLRHARYIGRTKTHLQNILTAAATNVVRIINWVTDIPLAKTRRSSFVKLMRPEPLTC